MESESRASKEGSEGEVLPTENQTENRHEACPTLSNGSSPIDSKSVDSSDVSVRYLHPVSLVFEIARGIRQQVIPTIVALFSLARGGRWGVVLGICFFALSLAYAVFRYMTLRYQISGEDLVVDEGFIFRKHRTVPIKKIQNLDLIQSPFHRLFGVAEVRIETASGAKPEAELRVLALSEVERLRDQIFAGRQIFSDRSLQRPSPHADKVETLGEELAPSLSLQGGNAPEPAHSARLLEIDVPMLLKAGLVSNRGMVMVAILFGTFFQMNPWEFRSSIDIDEWIQRLPEGVGTVTWILLAMALIFVAIVMLRLLSAVWYVHRFHGYTLDRIGEDLRIRCGLLTKVAASVPRHRIQFISIHQSWFAKKLGLASIRVESAGGGGDSSEDAASTVSRQWFIPVMPSHRIPEILSELRPGLIWNESEVDWQPLSSKAPQRMRRQAYLLIALLLLPVIYFRSILGAVGLVLFAVIAIWYFSRKAKAYRYARGPFGVAFRSGMLTASCRLLFRKRFSPFASISPRLIESGGWQRSKSIRLPQDLPNTPFMSK